MANYTRSTKDHRSAYPENAVAAHEWALYEPVLTPQQLRDRFLWGIPLISSITDPRTRVPAQMTDEQLKDMIRRATSLIQLETGIDIFPVKREEKRPYDRQEILDLGYIRTNYRPIRSVDKLSIAPGNSQDMTIISPEWISKEGFVKGEIRIVTTLDTIAGTYAPGTGVGSIFVSVLGGQSSWAPSFWNVEYTTGFDDGAIPMPLNELIGCAAAAEALSLLGTTNRSNSHSINMDGMGQSISTAGPKVYEDRIKMLLERKERLSKLFRARFGNKFALGNI
jgi:hypothetical protein